jgi:hypothetical protein
MRFQRYVESLAEVDKVIVDGKDCGIGLQLSHWPGNRTPAHLRSDLSVEIVLRFLADPQRDAMLAARSLVTNDHYDTDGLLAAWAFLEPCIAPSCASALIAAAATGDFYEITTPEALQFNLIVDSFKDPARSPIGLQLAGLGEPEAEQCAYETLLPLLPRLLYDTDEYECLWRPEYDRILTQLSWAACGTVSVREYPEQRLTVIETPARLDHFARNAFANGHRILETVRADRGSSYTLYYRELLWYDIVSRDTSPKHLLKNAADKLNALEPRTSKGAWSITTWTPALVFTENGNRTTRHVTYKEQPGISHLSVEDVTSVVREELTILDNGLRKASGL